MKKIISVRALVYITALMLLTNCTKTGVHKQACKIVAMNETLNGDSNPYYYTYNYTYNADGKRVSAVNGSFVTSYTYNGNTIVAYTTSSGKFSNKKIITLNENGIAANIRVEDDSLGNRWTNQALTYNGTELVKSTVTNSYSNAKGISTFTWSNGNLVSVDLGSLIVTYEYSDKASSEGDYFHWVSLYAGYEMFRTKNAVKSKKIGSDLTNISYSYGTDGKISSINFTATSSTDNYVYQYQCN